MKTALTEYIEYLEAIKDRDNIPSHVFTTAKNYLETEKQQIVDAVKYGQNNQSISISHEEKIDNDYYTSTFETNKETLK